MDVSHMDVVTAILNPNINNDNIFAPQSIELVGLSKHYDYVSVSNEHHRISGKDRIPENLLGMKTPERIGGDITNSFTSFVSESDASSCTKASKAYKIVRSAMTKRGVQLMYTSIKVFPSLRFPLF
jgi:hypothetical protein